MKKLYLEPTLYAFSNALAVFFAYLMHPYWSFSQEPWLVVTAFLMGQTAVVRIYQQRLNNISAILIGLFIATILGFATPSVLYVCLFFLWVMAGFVVSYLLPFNWHRFYMVVNFLLIVLLGTLPIIRFNASFQARLTDILIGSSIGFFIPLVLIRFDLYRKFRAGILPLLNAFQDYLKLFEIYSMKANEFDRLKKQKAIIEQSFNPSLGYPEWAFALGFNPGLRAGFRYFLLQLERLQEIITVMHLFAANATNHHALKELEPQLNTTLRLNQQLMSDLMGRLNGEAELHHSENFTDDIIALEASFQQIEPAQLALLDSSADSLKLAGLIKAMKDLRQLLFDLLISVPNFQVNRHYRGAK